MKFLLFIQIQQITIFQIFQMIAIFIYDIHMYTVYGLQVNQKMSILWLKFMFGLNFYKPV